MRDVSPEMTRRWKSPAKVGNGRPVIRATIQKQNLKKFSYDTAWANGGDFEPDKHRVGTFTSMIFGDPSGVREIRNIQTCTWTRSVDQDVATCTITFLNSEISPIGNPDEVNGNTDEFDRPGYFTYNRGDQAVSVNRWGFDTETGWNGQFVPDRIVKTYEGYGADESVTPALDPNLMQSGTWLIDKVTYTHDGSVTLEMRDLGRLLLDQIVFPPVVPYEEYPLTWSKFRTEQVDSREPTGGQWKEVRRLGTARSSNEKYVGAGLTDEPFDHYVTPGGGFNDHYPRHGLTRNDDEYWMSTGQESRNSTVYWELDLDDPTDIAALRVRMKGGPYRVYVSLADAGGWIGKRKVPYKVTTGGVDLDAKIPFVQSFISDRVNRLDVTLRKVYPNVRKVRLTYTQLQNFRVGEYPWRATLHWMELYAGNSAAMGFEDGHKLKVVGNYGDYTQIVKWVAAWGGFYWPPADSGSDYMRVPHAEGDEDDKLWFHQPWPDGILPDGRVWGDFMKTGTTGEADLTVDQFDKQPLMDIINYVRDLTGFIFHIDEVGGIVWRMPNLWTIGCYKSPGQLQNRLAPPTRRRRTTEVVVLDEKVTLLSYGTALDSTNIRERIFVANVVGGVGTVIEGFNPYPTGLRRTAGWTDQNFKTKRETRVMADMISAQQAFSWRRGKATIPGYPAIQVDDQVRIFERVTNETYYHYVLGITSTIDMEAGEWTYELDTHWLGERPSDAWTVRVNELPQATQNYLAAVGYEGTD